MPQGIGYGPLPPPPSFATAPGLPRITPAPPVDLSLIAPPQPQPVIPSELMPAPVLLEEPQQLPTPPGLEQEPQAAPVPTWLQSLLAQRQPDSAAPATSTTTKPTDGVAASSAGAATSPDPRDPISLATAGAAARVKAEQTALAEMRAADDAIAKASANQQRREAERAERERIARENVGKQNAAIQQALKQGPGTTWRDVAATGIQIAGAVLGAAFDRSGTLQRNLPNLLQAYVQQGQERTQAAFARQLQALQVGREGAQDELDEAMSDERRIEQAGAAARAAILEESQRQIQVAVQEGRVSMAELEAAGIPAQMEAELAAAQAKQAELEAEAQRKAVEQGLKLAKEEAELRLTEERIVGERADRAKQWAELDLSRQRLALDKDRSQALKQQDLLEVQKKKLDILKEQGLIDDRNLAKAVPLPGGNVLVANSAEQARDFSSQIASAEVLGGLMDQIAVALETGDRDFWGGKEGQELLAKWGAAKLATKDAEQLGAIQGADEALIENLIGKDPTSLSLGTLRSQAPRIREARRILEEKVNARGRSISSDFSGRKGRIELPRYEAPGAAVPSSQEAAKALLPIRSVVSGVRPRVEPKEFASHVKTLRETIAKDVGSGQRRDVLSDEPLTDEDITRVQALELAGTMKNMRAERTKLEQERAKAQEQARAATGGDKTALLKRMQELTGEIATVQQYEQRLGKELERERRLLYQRIRGGDPRAKRNVNPADQEAYKAVADLIGGL